MLLPNYSRWPDLLPVGDHRNFRCRFAIAGQWLIGCRQQTQRGREIAVDDGPREIEYFERCG